MHSGSRAHLYHTFGSLPVGGEFYPRSGPNRKSLLRKISDTRYEYAGNSRSRSGISYTMRRDARIEYPTNRISGRASGSVRERDTPTARTLKKLHDGELYKAFTAMQILEHEIDKIPADDLRAPIAGFRDKRWMIEKIRSIRADLDNLRSGMAARVWREH